VNRRQVSFAALQFRSTRDVDRLRRHAGEILKETRISRDGLDHILDAVQTPTPVGAGRDLPKVRTTSQKTVFKSVGVAHADLAVAEYLFERLPP
jgi:ornithine cyclodeaminase/alanine dehydrogenase-like protein (mu-crystallin family)